MICSNYLNNQKGALPILLLVILGGLVSYLAITSLAPFENKTLTTLYPKSDSSALEAIQPVGQISGNWDLTFSDDFNGTALDSTKWVTCYPWSVIADSCSHTKQTEYAWYTPQNVELGNGTAKLIAKKGVNQGPDGRIYNYTSGMITTGRLYWDTTLPPKYSYKYGYAEMRAKMPAGNGMWPAFWALPWSQNDPGKWPPEIDVLEILGHEPSTVHMTDHWQNPSGSHGQDSSAWTGPDFSKDFHTFGLDWQPGVIVWYIDGIERKRFISNNVPAEPMYLIANLEVGYVSGFGVPPDSTTPFPSTFEIDYIRVWQKATVNQTPSPPISPSPSPTIMPSPTPGLSADIVKPVISITSPLNNAKIIRNRNLIINADASDNIGLTKVEFYANNVLKCTDTIAPYSCNWSVPAQKNVTYNLTAKAYDPAGNITTSTTVKVTSK